MREIDPADVALAVGISLLLDQILHSDPTPQSIGSDPAGSAVAAAAAAETSAVNRSRIFSLLATGGNGAGSRTCIGSSIGDRVGLVIAFQNGVAGAPVWFAVPNFEGIISVQDKIQQQSGNFAGYDILVVLQGR